MDLRRAERPEFESRSELLSLYLTSYSTVSVRSLILANSSPQRRRIRQEDLPLKKIQMSIYIHEQVCCNIVRLYFHLFSIPILAACFRFIILFYVIVVSITCFKLQAVAIIKRVTGGHVKPFFKSTGIELLKKNS